MQRTLSQYFQASPEGRHNLMQPSNAKDTVLATLESGDIEVPTIKKIVNPPVPTGLVDDNGEPITVDTGRHSLIRFPYEDSPSAYLGTVSDQYELITPHDVASIYDEVTQGHKPDSVTFRKAGSHMVLFSKLDEFVVDAPVRDMAKEFVGDRFANYEGQYERGSIVDSHFFVSNPMDGGGSAVGGLMLRVRICANGMTAPMAVTNFTVSHTAGAKERLYDWLAHTWQMATGQMSSVTQALRHLAEIPIETDNVQEMAEVMYPLESVPTRDEWERQPRPRDWETQLVKVDRRNAKTRQRHTTINRLAKGGGHGIPIYDARGSLTAWEAFMAATEFENFRTGRNFRDSGSLKVVNNSREERIHKAYDYLNAVPVQA